MDADDPGSAKPATGTDFVQVGGAVGHVDPLGFSVQPLSHPMYGSSSSGYPCDGRFTCHRPLVCSEKESGNRLANRHTTHHNLVEALRNCAASVTLTRKRLVSDHRPMLRAQ